jgi:hypothetical protein
LILVINLALVMAVEFFLLLKLAFKIWANFMACG